MSKYLFLFYPFFLISHYTLTVAAIFKDEAPYLKEWIEYHKLMGVEHFRLYNNDSEDDYLSVLAPYVAQGEVTVIDWPSSGASLQEWARLSQWPAYIDAIHYFDGKSKWLALIDIDEFLFPLEASSMLEFLADYEAYPGVVLSWQCFGTSFIDEIPEGNLLLETLTWKAEEHSFRNLPVKSIVKPDCVDINGTAWLPHTCRYLANAPAVFPDKIACPKAFDVEHWHICSGKAVINHYVHRTENYFWNQKIAKKRRMEQGRGYDLPFIFSWYEDCNQVEDQRIFRFIPDLKQKMQK